MNQKTPPHARSKAARLITICLAFAAAAAAQAQPRYVVTDLGVLPGHTMSVATQVNDRGDVVGFSSPNTTTANLDTAFVWRNGVMSAVGKLPGGSYSEGNAINATGVITGVGDTGNGRPQAWVSSVNGLINIFPNNGGNTRTVFIGNNGMIGGYYTKSLSGWVSSWKGAIWTPDPKDPRKYRTTDLPILPGGVDPKSSSALPAAFNQLGQAVGSGSNDQIGQHAVFWNNDAAHSIIDLGTLPNDWSSNAYGINDLGQIVGTSHPPFASRATLWNNDVARTPQALSPLPGDNAGTAGAINNLGHIIGTSYYAEPGTWNATAERYVVWRDGGVFDLQAVLDAASGTGWSIAAVAAINNAGQIAASAKRDGQLRAVLLTPMAQ